jgi:hypothetical protein
MPTDARTYQWHCRRGPPRSFGPASLVQNWRRLLRGLVFRRRRLLPRLHQPAVVRPAAVLAEEGGMDAVPAICCTDSPHSGHLTRIHAVKPRPAAVLFKTHLSPANTNIKARTAQTAATPHSPMLAAKSPISTTTTAAIRDMDIRAPSRIPWSSGLTAGCRLTQCSVPPSASCVRGLGGGRARPPRLLTLSRGLLLAA